MLRYWFSERTLWPRDVFGEPVPLAGPHSDIPDVEVGIDVRHDAARRELDLAVLQSRRGQHRAQPVPSSDAADPEEGGAAPPGR